MGNNAQSTVVRVTCRQDVSRDCVVDVEDITLVADRWRCKMEVLERLAADPALSSIPVLVATARGDSATWVRCLALGARECHAKPISLRRMTASVETHLT